MFRTRVQASTPPAVQHHQRQLGAVFGLAVIVSLALTLFRVGWSYAMLGPFVTFLPVFLAIAWSALWSMRLTKRVTAAEGRLCPGCLYELADDIDACPECGRPDSAEDAREAWRRWGVLRIAEDQD